MARIEFPRNQNRDLIDRTGSLLQKGMKQGGRVSQFGPAEGASGNSATVFQLAARVL
jgi:hypothetical protein